MTTYRHVVTIDEWLFVVSIEDLQQVWARRRRRGLNRQSITRFNLVTVTVTTVRGPFFN